MKRLAAFCAAAALLGICGLSGACASGAKSEWVKPSGFTDEERKKALADCAAEVGPTPDAPMEQVHFVRDCMHRKGWVRKAVSPSGS